LGSLSFLRKHLGIYVSPVIFLLSSTILTLFLLKIVKQRLNDPKNRQSEGHNARQWLVILPVFFVVVFAGWLLLKSLFPQYPIDPRKSDIIPLIKVLTHRFSSGKEVYTEFSEFGYSMYPNYLPITWMPFIVADWLKLDYRTWTSFIFSGCALLSLFLLKGRLVQKSIFLILHFLIFLIFLYDQPAAFGWTVEPMITGFYLLLLCALFTKKTLWISVALVCCLLSRYAVILLLPFLFIIFLGFISRKKAFEILGLTALGVFILFIFPFLLHQPEILSKGYQYYTQGALAEWQGQSWQQPGSLPYQLSQGYGLAIFFYREDNVLSSLSFLQKTHIVINVLIPLLCTVWFLKKGKKWLPPAVFMALLLNFYLVCFFAFIQVPYAYLFFTPLITSCSTVILICHYPLKKCVRKKF
jgi:hypothetical protein